MEKYIILGHENPDVDSIISGHLYENYLTRKGINAEFIIPDKEINKESLDICMKHGLDPRKYLKELNYNELTKFILLDHHERANIGEISEIIDHHPTSKEIIIENYKNENASSTTCLIVRGKEEHFTKEEIKLAILAALVDTASFHSTKTKESDKIWALEMCQKHNINYEELYKTGLGLTDLNNLTEASLNGLKKYTHNNHQIQSSYVQIDGFEKNWPKLHEMIINIEDYLLQEELDMFAFIIHDMDSFQTTVYKLEPTGFIRKKFEKYTSRGTTIMPEIFQEFDKRDQEKKQKEKLLTNK